MANSTMVSKATSPIYIRDNSPTTIDKTLPTMGTNDPASASGPAPTLFDHCLRQHLDRHHMPPGIANLCSKAVAKKTKIQYSSKLKLWLPFAEKHNINLDSASLINFTEFLNNYFQQGASINSLKMLRSALKTASELRDPHPLDSPIISRMMSGFFNLRPPEVRGIQKWDPEKVLYSFRSWKHPSRLTLNNLAAKTMFLIALATGCRPAEINQLRLDRLTKQEDSWTFLLKTAKTYSYRNPNQDILCLRIKKNFLEQDLCPIFNLGIYIDRTSKIRDTLYVFVNSKPPHQQYHLNTCSSLIRSVLVQAGIVQKRVGVPLQKIRSVVSSTLYDAGIPLNKILSQCHWKSGGAFYTYYYRQNPSLPYASYLKRRAAISKIAKPCSYSSSQVEPIANLFSLNHPPGIRAPMEDESHLPQPSQYPVSPVATPSILKEYINLAESDRPDESLNPFPPSLEKAISGRRKKSSKKSSSVSNQAVDSQTLIPDRLQHMVTPPEDEEITPEKVNRIECSQIRWTFMEKPRLTAILRPKVKSIIRHSAVPTMVVNSIKQGPVYQELHSEAPIEIPEKFVHLTTPKIHIPNPLSQPLFAKRCAVDVRHDSFIICFHSGFVNPSHPLQLNSFLRKNPILPKSIQTCFIDMCNVVPVGLKVDSESTRGILLPLCFIPIILLPCLFLLINKFNVNIIDIPQHGYQAVFVSHNSMHKAFLNMLNKYHVL